MCQEEHEKEFMPLPGAEQKVPSTPSKPFLLASGQKGVRVFLSKRKSGFFFLLRINLDSLNGAMDVKNVALRTESSSGCSPSPRHPLMLQGAVREAQAGEASLLLLTWVWIQQGCSQGLDLTM